MVFTPAGAQYVENESDEKQYTAGNGWWVDESRRKDGNEVKWGDARCGHSLVSSNTFVLIRQSPCPCQLMM